MTRSSNFGVIVQPLGVKQAPISLTSFVAAYMGTAFGPVEGGGEAPVDKWYKISSLDQYKTTFGWSNNVASTGTVTFSFDAASAGNTIAAGTVVTATNGQTFTTDTLFTAVGAETTVDRAVTAVTPGAIGNVNAGVITTVDTSTIVGLTTVTVTNANSTTGGAEALLPDTDYTLESVAYCHFTLYNAGPICIKNVYNSTLFPGGVSTVAATDFSPSDIEDIQLDTLQTPLWFSIPEFGHNSTLFASMLSQRNPLDLFSLKIMVGYDPTEVTRADVITALGSGSIYRHKNVEISWPPLNGYPSEVHKICKKMQLMADPNKGQGMPYWSTSNQPTGLTYATTDITNNIKEAKSLIDVGCSTFFRNFNAAGVQNIGSKTAFFLTGTASADDGYVYDNDGASDQVNYNHNDTVLLLWDNVANPLNTSNIEQIVNKINDLGEAQVRAGAQIGYAVDFFPEDNPAADLASNQITIRERFLPAAQIDVINIKQTLDFSMFDNLFN